MKKNNLFLITLIIVFLFGCVALAATPSGSASVGNGGGSAGGGQTGSVSGQSGNGKGGTRTRYVYCWEDEDGMIHEFPGTYHLCQGAYTGMLSTTGTAPRTYEGTKHVQSRITNKLKDVTTVWGEKWGGEGIIANKKGATAYFDNENTAIWVWKTSKSGRYCGNGYPLGNGVKTPNSQITITENDSIRLLSDIKARATSKGDTSTLEIIEKIEKEEIVSHIKIYAEVRDGNGWGTSDDRAWEIVRKELYCVKPYYIEKEIAQGKISSSDGGAVYLGWDYVPGTANTLGNIKQSWKTLDDENIVEPIVTKMEKDEKYTKSINDAEIPEEYVHVKTTLKKFDKETSEESEIDYDPQEIIGDPEVGYEIVYWYSLGTEVKETWVTTTGEIIAGPLDYVYTPEEVEHTFSRQDKEIDEEIYTYIETTVDGVETPDGPITIPNDQEYHDIIYVYEKGAVIEVLHKDENTNKLIGIETLPLKEDLTVFPYTTSELKALGYPNHEYTGVEAYKDGKLIKKKSNDASYTISKDDNGNWQVIFWYKENEKINMNVLVYYACEKKCRDPLYGPINMSLETDKDYTIKIDKRTITDHTYAGYWKVQESNTPIPYTASGTTHTEASYTINYDGNTKYVIITIFYKENENELQKGLLKHIYINPLNNTTREIGSDNGINFKQGQGTAIKYYQQYVDNHENIVDSKGNIIYYDERPEDVKNESGDTIIVSVRTTVPIYYDWYYWSVKSDTTLDGGHIIAERAGKFTYEHYENGITTESRSFKDKNHYVPTSNTQKINYIYKYGRHEGEIYYTDQVVSYQHVLVGSSSLDNIIKVLNEKSEIVPTNGEKTVSKYSDSDYQLIAIKLNNEIVKGGTGSILSDTSYTVSFIDGKASQSLIFYYKLIPRIPDSEKGVPVVCDVSNSPTVVKLDESFSITIGNKGVHEYANDNGYSTPLESELWTEEKSWNKFFAKGKYARFDGMDVEYNGTLYKAGERITLVERTKDILEEEDLASTFTFTVPVWVEDNRYYTCTVWTEPLGKSNGKNTPHANEFDETAAGNATDTFTIHVIGKIYDFTVTNIQGDDIWKSMLSLPSTNDVKGEYKSPNISNNNKNLPIGQETQRTNKKYNYGIKKGTKFYFSVNTKGISNEAIEIVPRFYYISRDGSIKGEVNVFTKNAKGVYENIKALTSTRISNTKNANKLTREFGLEKQRAITLYNTVKFDVDASIGKYIDIKLNQSFKFPYLNYLKEEGSKWIVMEDEDTILPAVSHWYGDYLVPSDAKFADIGTAKPTESDFKNYNDGYVIVLFKIESQTSDKTYLSYNNVWKEEGMTAEYVKSVQLPRIAATGTLQVMDNGIVSMLDEGYAPVIIYQANVSTNQNYDTTGTH